MFRFACLLALLLSFQAPPAGAADIRLTQADGSPLVLGAPAERIVTLAPHLAEGVFAAGAGPRLAAFRV